MPTIRILLLSASLIALSGCDDEDRDAINGGPGSSDQGPVSQSIGCPPATSLGQADFTSTSQAKLDTDGDTNFRNTDPNWAPQTSGGVNSATSSFIVMSPTEMQQDGVSLGDWATIQSGSRMVYAKVLDEGPAGGTGEISVMAANQLGIQFTSSSAIVGDPVVTVNAFAGTSGIQGNCNSVASSME